jgi:hypothetical protein
VSGVFSMGRASRIRQRTLECPRWVAFNGARRNDVQHYRPRVDRLSEQSACIVLSKPERVSSVPATIDRRFPIEFHHNLHWSPEGRTIGSPSLQANARWNSGIFCKVAFVRYFASGCGSVASCRRIASGRWLAAHTRA